MALPSSYKGLIALLTIVIFLSLASYTSQQASNDNCFNFDDSCSLCIQQPECQWCIKKPSSNSSYHCFSNRHELDFCEEIENPQNFNSSIIDEPLTEPNKNKMLNDEKIVQLKPQLLKLKLRKGKPINITLTYRQIADYPLDLYYLMDLSRSMEKDKKTLAKLGKKLALTMRNLTSQFKIGFGSFVDKVMAPFVNVHPKENSCKGNSECENPFSFRNNLALTEQDTKFTRQVKAAKISTNVDTPEGGFDALMQAMVCEKEIGWRKNVRKIIVFSTDAAFHFAGDGKLAGVITPNDEQCHLNKQGMYDKYDVYDYPSIGQIEEVARKKGMHIIFAVKNHDELYKELAKRVKGTYGRLSSQSSNVVKLVADVYNSITGTFQLTEKSEGPEKPVSLRYFSSCGLGKEVQTNMCSGAKEGKTFEFNVEVTATNCLTKGSRETQIEIGTLQDSVKIDIELQCDCGCENEKHKSYQKDSVDCSREGTKQCDVCYCNDGFYGKECQCSRLENISDKKINLNKCRPEGSNSSVAVCSGRGRCECEVCNCWNENYGGKYCQCNKALCRNQVDSDIECSGHGQCDCNKCKCNADRQGEFCECRNDQACIPQGSLDGKKCSGNGECSCGSCVCKTSFTGKYCEECSTCGDGKCHDFQPCVQCSVWDSGPLSENNQCIEKCENFQGSKIQKIPTLDGPLREYARLCQFIDENTGCNFNFTYKYSHIEQEYTIYAQNNQRCPETVDALAITFGVISGIVAIGILTLVIWKILTTIHDRKEYANFEKETNNPKWGVDINRIYEEPTTTVPNPTFAKM